MTVRKLCLAQAGIAKRGTRVGDLRRDLGITGRRFTDLWTLSVPSGQTQENCSR
jgi:hypothetical protein